MRSEIRKAQIAVLNLEEFAEIEQPEYFEDGDDIIPTGDPEDKPLGKRPGSEGAETSDNIFPETEDPDSGDAVAHVSYPSEVKDGRAAYKSETIRKKGGIAEEIGETLSDLSSAMHELREVEQVLADRDMRVEQEEVDESAAYDEAMAAASKASGVAKAFQRS